MTVVTRAPGRPVRSRLKHRKSVSKLSNDELRALRSAWSAFAAIQDDRGFQYHAGWHGVPFGWCGRHDGDPFFLPWHRAYLFHFELALQDRDPSHGVTLPWWDWINEPGIPDAYEARTIGGKQNPLYASAIAPYATKRRPNWPRRTKRAVGANQGTLPPPLGDRWDWVMEPTSYMEFSRRITLLHNNIHGWVGGSMGEVDWAAYDPIFWAHHAMVDRLWRIWQHGNPGALPPVDILDAPLQLGKAPILTVRQTIDVKRLGYDYAVSSETVPGNR
jgi:tyrosinase